MNRNAESRFAINPQIDVKRSRFDRPSSVKLSFNVGDLIPFYVDEVLPGDTIQIDTSKVVRLQTMLTPVMDNMYLDTYYFYVPNRLVWSHWRELMGENTASPWIPAVQYQVPQLEAPSGGWNVGTIADYFGIPTGVDVSVNALPFRAYALICNEFFRDENLTDPLSIPVSDSTVTGVNTGNYITDTAKGGLPFKAAKYHDYFTSCLPSPQKGADVPIPARGFASVGTGEPHDVFDKSHPMSFRSYDPTTLAEKKYNTQYAIWPSTQWNSMYSEYYDTIAFSNNFTNGYNVVPTNLWADLSTASLTTINQLRIAMQIQKLLERDARGGTRYIELLKAHFGVTSPDSRLQRPEYLGGNRVPITINQIIQQSESGTTPQGHTTGMSVTTDVNSDFTHSFVEHGFIIGLCVARYDHTYQQGIERFWSRKSRYDYYWPVFANIGEMAVLNKEIYADGSSNDDLVFGYQEAWADYRYKPNRVSGEMRSAYAQSLDVWHLADDYSSLPVLSDSWIREDKSNVDRVLAVTSSVSNQLFADIYIKNRSTRPMPINSIPGFMDHN